MLLQRKFLVLFSIATLVAIFLFVAGVLRNGSTDYWYLPYNLVLAYIPLGLMLCIKQLKDRFSWQNWRVLGLSGVWLLFLPNSFYLVTDFIHLYETSRIDVVQDIVMLMQYSVLGILAGFMSLYTLQTLLWRKMSEKAAWAIIGGVLYVSSLAIYLGRELRWNSWDLIVFPGPVLRDLFMLWWNPSAAGPLFWMTASFFVSLGSLYLLFWAGAKPERKRTW